MTPEQLKASILQYAIQGKLVEQRPEEGTSEELYKGIQAEKTSLIKNGTIKKEKPLAPIIEDEIPFDIPESWKWCRLGALTYNWGQKTPDNRFCYVDVGSVNNISHTLNSENTVVEAKDASSRAKKIVKYGDVIFATIRPYLKNICIIDRDFPYEPIVSTAFAVMHCPEGLLNKYLYYYLLSPTFMNFANARDKAKGVAYPAIGEKNFFNGIIALPPIEEQQRIVAKIEELLPYVDRYAAAYEKLEQFNAKFPEDMKKSILQYAIQGKLVDQRSEEGTGEELYRQIQEEKKRLIKEGKIKKEKPLAEIAEDEIPFDIPESWKWVRLLDVVEEKPANGFSPKGVDYQTAVKNLTLTATTSGYFKADAFKYVDIQLEPDSKYWLKKDDLLIQRSNSRELVGTSCIYTGDDDAFIYPDLMMKLRVMNGVDVKYVDHVLKSPLTRNYFSKTASGTSESMPKINQGIVSATLIPLPPLAEQKRIVAKLEEILPLCERLK